MNVALEKRRKSWMSKNFSDILLKDGIQPEIVEEVSGEEPDQAQEFEKHDSVIKKIRRVVERVISYTPLQITLLVFAILDVAVVVIEIIVTLQVYKITSQETNDALSQTIDTLTSTLHISNSSDLLLIIQAINSTYCNCDCVKNNQSLTLSNGIISKPIVEAVEFRTSGTSSNYFDHNLDNGDIQRNRIAKRGDTQTQMDLTDIDRDGFEVQNPVVEALHVAETVLNMISIVILGVFVIIAFLKLFVEGAHYFKRYMEIVDTVIVILSFILDILKYSGVISKDATEAVIVILLLWQIVRMFNGIMLSELKRLEFRILLLKRLKKKVDAKMTNVNMENQLLQTEVKSLQNLSNRKGATQDEIGMCHPVRLAAKPSVKTALSFMALMSFDMSSESDITDKFAKFANAKNKTVSFKNDGSTSGSYMKGKHDAPSINLPRFFNHSLSTSKLNEDVIIEDDENDDGEENEGDVGGGGGGDGDNGGVDGDNRRIYGRGKVGELREGDGANNVNFKNNSGTVGSIGNSFV